MSRALLPIWNTRVTNNVTNIRWNFQSHVVSVENYCQLVKIALSFISLSKGEHSGLRACGPKSESKSDHLASTSQVLDRVLETDVLTQRTQRPASRPCRVRPDRPLRPSPAHALCSLFPHRDSLPFLWPWCQTWHLPWWFRRQKTNVTLNFHFIFLITKWTHAS